LSFIPCALAVVVVGRCWERESGGLERKRGKDEKKRGKGAVWRVAG
jgi:hypothetical protein